jgi:hypothetical protein
MVDVDFLVSLMDVMVCKKALHKPTINIINLDFLAEIILYRHFFFLAPL